MVRGPGPLCRDGRDPQELELIKQMGYRLRLETADLPTAASHGSEIDVTIKMADDDSGSLFNPRGVELILRSVQLSNRGTWEASTGYNRLLASVEIR